MEFAGDTLLKQALKYCAGGALLLGLHGDLRAYDKRMQVTCVFEEAAEGGYVAYVEEIPGANSQGETLDEARENLRDAITLLLEANRDLAEKSLHQRRARAIREAWTVGQE